MQLSRPPEVRAPRLSVVVVMHNMRREAERTLYTLSQSYQRGISADDYEVLVMDSGSSEPLDPHWVASFGPQFGYGRVQPDQPTPVEAMNLGAHLARGSTVACAIDGARMLSPGCLGQLLLARDLGSEVFAYTLGFHLGPKPQQQSMLEGYDQQVEDQLLDSFDWRSDGYKLFQHSAAALSSAQGAFGPIAESNLFALPRQRYLELGGYDCGFTTPGGGYTNLDLFARLMAQPEITPVLLLGEATFHQFHGGAATNIPGDHDRHKLFKEEYQRLRGQPFQHPQRRPIYLGHLRSGQHA